MRFPLGSIQHAAGQRRQLVRAFALSAGAFALAGCDLPSSAPKVDQRWIVPGETSRIAVANLLPSGVSILPDSSGFTLNGDLATINRPLSADCDICAAGNGSLGVKPALIVNATVASSLASDVSSATLTSGSLALSVTNNYNFDPIRPNGNTAPYGTATITVSNGATVLGSMVIDGATRALAANGGTMNINVPLTGAVSGSTPVSVQMTVNSPEGSPVVMDANRTIAVNATPTNLKVSNALIAVGGRMLSSSSTVDFSDVGDAVADRAEHGALLLTIDNPFTVTSTLSVKLRPDSGATIIKSVVLGTGQTTRSIEFSKDELQSLFGHNVTITISGPADASSGLVRVSPKQAVIVKTRFDLTLSVGG